MICNLYCLILVPIPTFFWLLFAYYNFYPFTQLVCIFKFKVILLWTTYNWLMIFLSITNLFFHLHSFSLIHLHLKKILIKKALLLSFVFYMSWFICPSFFQLLLIQVFINFVVRHLDSLLIFCMYILQINSLCMLNIEITNNLKIQQPNLN